MFSSPLRYISMRVITPNSAQNVFPVLLRRLSVARRLGALALLAVGPSQAANIWDAGGADTNINTAANWDDDTAPNLTGGTATLIFATAGSTATLNTDTSLAGLVFNRDADFTLGNGGASALTLGAGGITLNQSSSTTRRLNISESLALGAAQTWSATVNGTTMPALTVAGAVSGTSLVTLAGVAGRTFSISVTGNNSAFSGGWNLGQGIHLRNETSNPTTSLGTGDIVFRYGAGSSSNSILAFNQGFTGTIANNIVVNNATAGAAAVIQNFGGFGGNNVVTFAGNFTTGALQSPSGQLNLNPTGGANATTNTEATYRLTGNWTAYGNFAGSANLVSLTTRGTLQIDSANAIASTANPSRVTYQVTANESTALQADSAVRFSAKLILGGAYTLASPVTFSGSATAANFNSLGARHATGGTATFSGLLTQNTNNTAGLNLFAQTSGAVADFTGNIASQALTDTNPVRVNAPYSYQTGSGLTNQTPAGTVKFTGAKTYSGPTLLNGGTLHLAGTILNSSALTIAGGSLLLPDGTTNSVSNTAPVSLGGSTASSLVLAGSVSETVGVLTLAGSTPATIDFGSGAATLTFANSSGAAWPGSAQIVKWSGGSTDRLYVGTTGAGLTSPQLGKLTFLNPRQLTGSFNAIQRADGEVVPEGWTGSPAVVISASTGTAVYGDAVSFTAFVHIDGVIAAGASGSVEFKVDGTTVQTVSLSNGQAVFTTSALVLGTRTLSATYSGGGTGSRTVTIIPAPLTLSAFNLTKPSGQTKTLAGKEFTASGLKNGDTVGSVVLTASGGLAADAAVGTYTLTPSAASGGTFVPSNYTITYVAGTLSVLGTAVTGATDIDTIFANWPSANKQTIYVNAASGNDTSGNGSFGAPYASIKRALGVAAGRKRTGIAVKISIAPGTYREGAPGDNFAFQFNVQLADVHAAPLILEGEGWNAANPQNTRGVIVSCSDDWSGAKGPNAIQGWTKNNVNNTWSRSGTTISAAWTYNATDGTWSKPWPYNWGVPARNVTFGVADAFLRYELVVVNGQPYYQINPAKNLNGTNYVNVNSVNGVFGGFAEGDESAPTNVNGGRLTESEGAFWVHDATLDADKNVTTMGRITIRPPDNAPGFDPNAAANLLEVSTRRNGFQFWVGANSTFTLAPTPTNVIIRNLTFQHSGLYGALIQGQNNLLIEDCRFIKGKRGGLNLFPSTGATLRRVECSENGEYGAGFSESGNGLIEYCKFNNNSRQGEILGYTGWSVCGLKFYSSKGANANVTLFRSEARNNRSTGFWWDTGQSECLMIECVSVNNSSNGTFIEANMSPANSYSQESSTGVGTDGIPNLGTRPTVTVLRTILANNKPPANTVSYRTNKNAGVFFSENENAVLDGNLIYGNHVQIGTYDNVRGEQRNFTFRNNLIAAQSTDERLYAVKSSWDSQPTIALKQLLVDANGNPLLDANNKKQYVAKTSAPQTLKGGWYALYDGLSGTTNDNRYYHPELAAFPARSQRWGTDSWSNPAKSGYPNQPTLTLAEWRQGHRNNANNSFADRNVDSRSTLINTPYDDTKPLVAITPLVDSLTEGDPATAAFNVTRVSALTNGYDAALTVAYTVRTEPGDATNGTDIEAVSGTVILPAGQRSATINLTAKTDALLEYTETITLVLDTSAGAYVAANPNGTILLFDVPPPNVPAAPTGLTATAVSDTQVTLAWTASATATSYTVKRATTSGGPYAIVAPSLVTTSYNDTGRTAGSTYYYVVFASNTGGEGPNSTEASATTWTPLQAWRVSNSFALDGSGTSANAADPDGDGLNNLLEYALNGTPTDATSAPLPTAALAPSTSTLTLTFYRARPATELTYTVQASSDLAAWTDLANNPGTVGQNVTVNDTPPEGATRRFMRLNVSMP